jgi:hypothetical protein
MSWARALGGAQRLGATPRPPSRDPATYRELPRRGASIESAVIMPCLLEPRAPRLFLHVLQEDQAKSCAACVGHGRVTRTLQRHPEPRGDPGQRPSALRRPRRAQRSGNRSCFLQEQARGLRPAEPCPGRHHQRPGWRGGGRGARVEGPHGCSHGVCAACGPPGTCLAAWLSPVRWSTRGAWPREGKPDLLVP